MRKKFTPFMVSVAPAYDKQSTFEKMKIEPENGSKTFLQNVATYVYHMTQQGVPEVSDIKLLIPLRRSGKHTYHIYQQL